MSRRNKNEVQNTNRVFKAFCKDACDWTVDQWSAYADRHGLSQFDMVKDMELVIDFMNNQPKVVYGLNVKPTRNEFTLRHMAKCKNGLCTMRAAKC